MSRIEVHWETDLLRTGKDFAVELPVAAMEGGKLPEGVTFKAPVKRQLELGPQRMANGRSQMADGTKQGLSATEGPSTATKAAEPATDESVLDAHQAFKDAVIGEATRQIDQAAGLNASGRDIGEPMAVNSPGAARTPGENAVQVRRGGRGKSQAAK